MILLKNPFDIVKVLAVNVGVGGLRRAANFCVVMDGLSLISFKAFFLCADERTTQFLRKHVKRSRCGERCNARYAACDPA